MVMMGVVICDGGEDGEGQGGLDPIREWRRGSL